MKHKFFLTSIESNQGSLYRELNATREEIEQKISSLFNLSFKFKGGHFEGGSNYTQSATFSHPDCPQASFSVYCRWHEPRVGCQDKNDIFADTTEICKVAEQLAKLLETK